MNEKSIVEKLKVQLAHRFKNILIHQNLATLTRFKKALASRFGYLPVLNEIDMVLTDSQDQLFAIEVKYFTVENGSFNRPFYDGISQSLSLLRYGFDNVALWHFFSSDIAQGRLDRYGAATWWFIHNQTGLPLDFTYFRVNGNSQSPEFLVMQYTSPYEGVELIPIDRSNFEITWKNPNPFRDTDDGKYLRNALVSALGMGDIVSE